MMNLTALAEDYRRQRESLLTEFPELAEDKVALTDTLDGLTNLTDVVARFIRDALDDDALAEAVNARIKDMTTRRQRLSERADKRRAIALSIMNAAELPRVVQPDFTASAGYSRKAVNVSDVEALPAEFVKVTKAPDKKALYEAMTGGASIPGAMFGNSHPTLIVRTK